MVNAVQRSKLYNRCDWTQGRRLSIARATGDTHLKIQSFSFIQWEKFPEDVPFYFFFLFSQKQSTNTEDSTFSFSLGWCILLCFITGRYKKDTLFA